MNTLDKSMRILSLFVDINPVLSVAEISERLEIPQSTAYRYVATLRKHQFLEQDSVMGSYRLGTRILELARSVAKPSLQEIALPLMEQLSRRSGESVILSGRRQHEGICLEKVEGHHALRVSHERGAVFPLHAGTSGKVLMAHLEARDQDEILRTMQLVRFSETTITDPQALKDELRRIREQGYAESDGEVLRGTYGIGAPIFSASRRILAGLSVSAPKHRLQRNKRTQVIEYVVAAATAITQELKTRGVE